MSDRRFVAALIALLLASVGIGTAVLGLVALPDPFVTTGETGQRLDVTRELIGAVVVGVLLAVGGGAGAGALLRDRRPDAP